MEVKRTGGGSEASVTPNIPGFPKDSPICIKSGTTVTWQGAGKNTGFMADFAASSPFDPSGTISGGSDRPVTVTARKPGCFKYSLGGGVDRVTQDNGAHKIQGHAFLNLTHSW